MKMKYRFKVGVGVGGWPPYNRHLYYYNEEGIYLKLREQYKVGTCVSKLHVDNEILIKKNKTTTAITFRHTQQVDWCFKNCHLASYEKCSINLHVE